MQPVAHEAPCAAAAPPHGSATQVTRARRFIRDRCASRPPLCPCALAAPAPLRSRGPCGLAALAPLRSPGPVAPDLRGAAGTPPCCQGPAHAGVHPGPVRDGPGRPCHKRLGRAGAGLDRAVRNEGYGTRVFHHVSFITCLSSRTGLDRAVQASLPGECRAAAGGD